MAAAGSRFASDRRGATTGQGAKARREGTAPFPSLGVAAVAETSSRMPAMRVLAGGSSIRVIIVENHKLVSESTGLLLDAQRDLVV